MVSPYAKRTVVLLGFATEGKGFIGVFISVDYQYTCPGFAFFPEETWLDLPGNKVDFQFVDIRSNVCASGIAC